MGVRAWNATSALAIAALLSLLGSAAGSGIEARLESLRALELSLEASTSPSEGAQWTVQLDGDASGAVSAEELSTFIATLETLIAHPAYGPLEAYNETWAAENASGAGDFTLDGRANMSAFALTLAPAYRVTASLDGAAGALDRVAASFTNLTGTAGANATIDVLLEFVFAWGPANASREQYRLEVSAPPLTRFHLRVGGSFEVVSFESLVPAAINSGRTEILGRTIDHPVVVIVKERPVSNAALAIVAAAILLPAALVGFVALWTSREMRVKETPLPVEPRYK